MRLYRHISSFRILSNPCNKQGLHSTARHFIPDNTLDASGSDGKVLSQHKAYEMVKQMNELERDNLRCALNQFELDQMKIKFEVEAHAVIPPTKDELMKIMIVNAVPFLGFGFLDNFFMIVAGDYIEHTMGMYMCISTMAAAGFGNTISDVLGLGLAHYVERFCEFLGLRPPRLTQEQMELKSSRRVASYGRALGIMIGCLLGMCPLLFMKKRKSDNDAGNESETQKTVKL
ncbi:transmembrane protein 65 isoform X2 [Bradysia coprophila]|uniref:transmembrane protein 65 isoform X2 n=1 Tax=Bradysia coprophila TaxID=38358 RepID=UPI00187DB55D|nr:transmembrane protein 65 isoform X2 [Bradysia coprophila]